MTQKHKKKVSGVVLTRRPDEEILIGDDISVKVTRIDFRRKQVKLLVKAPEDILILRKELKRDTDSTDTPQTGN